MTDIKPVIDDKFWFDRSGEMVKDAGARLDKWADRMRDMIVWGYSLYTATSIFVIEYKKIDEWGVLAVLSAPYIFIILVYWKSQQAQVPIDVKFHPNSPAQIKEAYETAYEKKSKRVNSLVRWSFIAMFAIAAALITSLIMKNQSRAKPPVAKEYYFNGAFQKDKNDLYLVLSGEFPADSALRMPVTEIYLDKTGKQLFSTDTTLFVLIGKNGLLQYQYKLDSAAKVFWSVTWSQYPYKKTLQREFVLTPQ